VSGPTPAAVRELAVRARQLADDLDAAYAAAAVAGGPTEDAAVGLVAAADQARLLAVTVEHAADRLVRVRVTAADPGACGVVEGVCPEHGATLSTSAGRSWCTAPGCGRTWGYDRLSTPCPDRVTHEVTDLAGATTRMCGAHARDAAQTIDGARVVPLADGPQMEDD